MIKKVLCQKKKWIWQSICCVFAWETRVWFSQIVLLLLNLNVFSRADAKLFRFTILVMVQSIFQQTIIIPSLSSFSYLSTFLFGNNDEYLQLMCFRVFTYLILTGKCFYSKDAVNFTSSSYIIEIWLYECFCSELCSIWHLCDFWRNFFCLNWKMQNNFYLTKKYLYIQDVSFNQYKRAT
jgi:hypothetical protein